VAREGTKLRTGHSVLLVAYLHCIGHLDCPHCNGAKELSEHLVLQYPVHNQA